MPKKDIILNLPGFTLKKVCSYSPLVLEVAYRRVVRCPVCGNRKLRKKASFMRQVRHETIGLRQTVLRFKSYKFYCKPCQRYFHQRFPGILPYQRATEKLREEIFHYHTPEDLQKLLTIELKRTNSAEPGSKNSEEFLRREFCETKFTGLFKVL